MKAISVDESNFVKEVLEYPDLVLVDFYGPGCASCRALAPVVDSLDIKTAKVNISEAAELANYYSITSVPALIFFKNGDIVETLTGAQSKSKLNSIIEENK